MEEQIDTEDFGEKQVQIVPIGKFVGSSLAGEPVQEEIDKQSLEQLAVKLNAGDEVLCDIDHQSCKVGADKDTSAAGWFSRFVVDPIKGLLATLKFTKKGRDLAQSREYRYLSPALSFKDGKVDDLHSVSYTNTPAFKDAISPIINSAPAEQETITMEMTKEELAEMIKQAVKAELEAAEVAEEAVNEQPAEKAEEESKEELGDEAKAEEADKEAEKKEVVEETKVEETEVEEKTEEPAEEDKKEEEEKKEEVIKIEVLNSAPDKTPEICKNETPEWQSLKGKAFFDWLKAHPGCK